MIVIDMTRTPDEERATRIQAEIQLVKQQCAASVAEYRWRQALEAERARLRREDRERRRRYFVRRVGWFSWGWLLGLALGLLARGGQP